MKKTTFLVIILLLVIYGCKINYIGGNRVLSKAEKQEIEQDIRKAELLSEHFVRIKNSMIERKHLTFNELDELLTYMAKPQKARVKFKLASDEVGYGWVPELYEMVSIGVKKDYLPFEAMFYLALEKEDFNGAENIRRSWLSCLNMIAEFFKLYRYPINRMTGHPMSIRDFCYVDIGEYRKGILNWYNPYREKEPSILRLIEKVNGQWEKLTAVVGLTDPMLVKLRKELSAAIADKNWDDAQKIQNIITARVNELRPQQHQVAQQKTQGGTTTVIVQQPSEQHIKVEHVPRYGAEDVGRAISLLQGRGGSLTGKEAGTLKMLDILMKR